MPTFTRLLAFSMLLAIRPIPVWPGEVVSHRCLNHPNQSSGVYFQKKVYVAKPLPGYKDTKALLPAPIYDDQPLWVETYWKAWELAFRNFHEPPRGSGLVSQFIDAAFNDDIFEWDSSFMTMFTNTASPLVPGISTLDNSYARQLQDGEICREIVRASGQCLKLWTNHECGPLASRFGWGGFEQGLWKVTYKDRVAPATSPTFTLDALNHPILAWAELESYQVTGDKERLRAVWEPLVRYYDVFTRYLRQGNGLYLTDWASMDNSPRNQYLKGGGTGVDTSSEMVLFARNLAEIAKLLGKGDESDKYTHDAQALSLIINQRLWDDGRKFYFDLTLGNERAPVKSIAAFWTLLAGVASRDQARDLVDELLDSRTFGRPNAVPTLAADEPLYDPKGEYWRGSVWAPTTTVVIRGLDAYGYHNLARRLALQHLQLVASVYQRTGTLWENYSPEFPEPGSNAKPDFVGWTGIGPILYLLEYGIGLKPISADNTLSWDLRPGGRQGCERYRFNGHVVSMLAEPEPGHARTFHITVESDGEFTLRVGDPVQGKALKVVKGSQHFTVEV
jgi:hypothetical protein